MHSSPTLNRILVCIIITKAHLVSGQIPFPETIAKIKPFVVAIVAQDDTTFIVNGDSIKYQSVGSGVFLGIQEDDIYAVTNEHVIAIKDKNLKTIRYARNILVLINLKGRGTTAFPAKIRKVDEKRDLAAVRVFFPQGFARAMKDSIIAEALRPDLWELENNLKEGETVIYSGYPLRLGIGPTNFPLTRTGIISQLVPGNNTFLIDAFVQRGYSGSPVFVIRNEPNTIPSNWHVKFIGIASSYPTSILPVLKKVQYVEIPGVGVPENPGFALVIGVSAIKQLLGIQ